MEPLGFKLFIYHIYNGYEKNTEAYTNDNNYARFDGCNFCAKYDCT
jgi:hypothetical protein